MARILLVDNRADSRQAVAHLLLRLGHLVEEATDVSDAVTRFRTSTTDLVLSDVRMNGDRDGLALLRIIRDERPCLPVILYTRFAQVSDAVLAIKLGAFDYLGFPLDPDKLVTTVHDAVEQCSHTVPVGAPRTPPSWPFDLVAVSPAMRAVLDFVARIGPSDLTVILQGETGAGKEVVARALHGASERRNKPIVALNCAAIPESLFEAELFGYRKGAFTGALAEKPGLTEEANGGTLFLDEIGELPMLTQVHLLRFLEDGEVRRLGATKSVHVDVRVIAATNRVLREEVARGCFRADLFYRLNTTCCEIPSLRHRLDDLEPLIDFWLARLAPRLGSRVRGVTPGGLALLRAHPWPGNIRELRNVLQHATSLTSGELISEHELAGPLGLSLASPPERASVGDDERSALVAALERNRWQLARTATSVGISRSTLWRKLRRHGIRLRQDQT